CSTRTASTSDVPIYGSTNTPRSAATGRSAASSTRSGCVTVKDQNWATSHSNAGWADPGRPHPSCSPWHVTSLKRRRHYGKRWRSCCDRTSQPDYGCWPRLPGPTEPRPSPGPDLQARYAAELPRQYEQHVDLLGAKGRALPGSRQALAALADRPEVIQTV